MTLPFSCSIFVGFPLNQSETMRFGAFEPILATIKQIYMAVI
jgi:hypothetical protein